jgi:hypothetical protein
MSPRAGLPSPGVLCCVGWSPTFPDDVGPIFEVQAVEEQWADTLFRKVGKHVPTYATHASSQRSGDLKILRHVPDHCKNTWQNEC